jgi:hypothetical protein
MSLNCRQSTFLIGKIFLNLIKPISLSLIVFQSDKTVNRMG